MNPNSIEQDAYELEERLTENPYRFLMLSYRLIDDMPMNELEDAVVAKIEQARTNVAAAAVGVQQNQTHSIRDLTTAINKASASSTCLAVLLLVATVANVLLAAAIAQGWWIF